MEFHILGPLEVRSDGHVLELGGHKQRELLAVLLVHAGTVVPQDRLIDALWEDDPPDSAVKALQVYVSGLRKVVGKERLLTRSPGYLLAPEPGELDAHRFEALRKQGKVREALALWRGPALVDFQHRRFARPEIARLDELRLASLEERIDEDLAGEGQDQVVGELAALVQAHPLRERLRGQLMHALYRSGRQAEALDAYRAAREALVEGLGIEPSRALRELHRQILEQDPRLETARARRKTAPRLQSDVALLPSALTRLVGRSRELGEIAELLGRDGMRLLTLTGPGGTGKTRLAVEVARELAPNFDEGARFVSLAPLADPELVLPTIARALGVRRHEGESELGAVRRVLGDASLLLVLDNYEHLLGAAPVATGLASSLPGVTILATSRTPLRVSGEHLWPVSPLDVPARDMSWEPRKLADVTAVALFVDRAQAVSPTFRLDDEHAVAVGEICVRLDGLPLAIELAAARIGTFPAETMLARLDRALPLLDDGPRDVPERQQTLEAAFAWSYDLLDPSQQRLVRELSVFAGGWTVDAAAAVCGASLADLGSLVDTSLIREQPSEGQRRFTMLQTIREFAYRRLVETGDRAAAGRRHAEHFLALTQEAEAGLRGPSEAVWMERLELEHDNLRAALGSSVEAGDATLALRLGCTLSLFWYTRGHFAEGRLWLGRALESADACPDDLVARGLLAAARLAVPLGDFSDARSLAERSLAVSRAAGDPAVIRGALGPLGLALLGEGDLDAAVAVFEEAYELSQKVGHLHGEATSILNLGYVALLRDDLAEAEARFRRSAELLREFGDPEAEAFALVNLSLVELRRDDAMAAAEYVRDSLAAFVGIGSTHGIGYGLECLAAIAAATDHVVETARLLGSAEELRARTGVRLQAYEQALHDSAEAFAREGLGADGLRREWEHGRGMTVDEACAYALTVCDALRS